MRENYMLSGERREIEFFITRCNKRIIKSLCVKTLWLKVYSSDECIPGNAGVLWHTVKFYAALNTSAIYSLSASKKDSLA